jgi:hypothetical protein
MLIGAKTTINMRTPLRQITAGSKVKKLTPRRAITAKFSTLVVGDKP